MAKRKKKSSSWTWLILILAVVGAVVFLNPNLLAAGDYNSNFIYTRPQYGHVSCISDNEFFPVEITGLNKGDIINCPPDSGSGYTKAGSVQKCEVEFYMDQDHILQMLGNALPFNIQIQLFLDRCDKDGCTDLNIPWTGNVGDGFYHKLTTDLAGNANPATQEWIKIDNVKLCYTILGVPTPVCPSDLGVDPTPYLKTVMRFKAYHLEAVSSDNYLDDWTTIAEGCVIPSGKDDVIASTDDISVGDRLYPGDDKNWIGHLALAFGDTEKDIYQYQGQDVVCVGNKLYTLSDVTMESGLTIKTTNTNNPLATVECCPPSPYCDPATFTLQGMPDTGDECTYWDNSEWFDKPGAGGATICRYDCVNGYLEELECKANPCLFCDVSKGEVCTNYECVSAGQRPDGNGGDGGDGGDGDGSGNSCLPFVQRDSGTKCVWLWDNVLFAAVIVIVIFGVIWFATSPKKGGGGYGTPAPPSLGDIGLEGL